MHKKLHDTRHKTIIYAILVTGVDWFTQIITVNDILEGLPAMEGVSWIYYSLSSE